MTAPKSTVYLVWEGQYSYKDVLAVFSNEADAQAYAAKENADSLYGDAHVVPMPLDSPEQVAAIRGIKPRWRFDTWGWHKDVLRSVWPTLALEKDPTLEEATNKDAIASGYPAHYWAGVIAADSEEEALKIANDFYAQKQAEQAGIA